MTSKAFGRLILSWILILLYVVIFTVIEFSATAGILKEAVRCSFSRVCTSNLCFYFALYLSCPGSKLDFTSLFFFLKKLPEMFWRCCKLHCIMWNYYHSFPPTLPLCFNSGGPLGLQPPWPVMEVRALTCQSTTLEDLWSLPQSVLQRLWASTLLFTDSYSHSLAP